MLLRAATTEDAEAIGKIKVAAWRAAYRAFMPVEYLASLNERQGLEDLIAVLQSLTPPFHIKVAESGGNVVGYSFVGAPRYTATPETLELWALNIHPTFSRQGIGRRLLHEALAKARELNCTRLELWCIEGNGPATSLYESSGFVRTGQTRTTSGLTGHRLFEVAYAIAA